MQRNFIHIQVEGKELKVGVDEEGKINVSGDLDPDAAFKVWAEFLCPSILRERVDDDFEVTEMTACQIVIRSQNIADEGVLPISGVCHNPISHGRIEYGPGIPSNEFNER